MIIILAFLAAIFVVCLVDGFYTVGEQESAIVMTFGKIERVDNAGLYLKVPLVQSVRYVDMTTRGLPIGYKNVNGVDVSVENESMMITSDFNFVNIDFYLEYKVSDPVSFVFQTTNPEQILRNFALSAIRSTVVQFTVDDVITTAKPQIQSEVRQRLSSMLEKNNIGLMIVNLTVQDAEPPTTEIVQAFKSVETAKQGKETAINVAKKYRSEQIPLAEAKADKIMQDAKAKHAARVAEANGQVARFNNMYEQFVKYPLITKRRMYFEALEDVLPNSKVFVTDGKTQNLMPLDRFDGTN